VPASTVRPVPAQRAASCSTTSIGTYAKSGGKKNSATHLRAKQAQRVILRFSGQCPRLRPFLALHCRPAVCLVTGFESLHHACQVGCRCRAGRWR
jgi:hypothetical protein